MSGRLPEYINPLQFADQRRRLEGTVRIDGLTRLADALMNTDGDVTVDLVFGRDGRTATVTGTIQADLQLQCQCCLDVLHWPVSVTVRLGMVSSLDAAGLLSEDYEPLVLEAEQIAVADIVQDELLLAIPYCPQHSQCGAQAERGEKPDRPNPFGILADLIK
jgi:uncharacterized protein